MKNKDVTTNTLTLKLWKYFVFFAVSIFVILWFMQVILLQSYYSSMKKNEVIKLSREIENNYYSSDIKEIIDNIAYKNALSIFLFNINGDVIYNSSNYSGDVSISQMPSRPIVIETKGIVEKILESPNQKISYTINVDKFKTELYVYGKLMDNKNACLVMVSSIDPVDATTSIIQSQLIYITIIALLFSSVISIFMSRRISRPIQEITSSARKLALGNYDTKFEKAGYVEIDELADTLNFATAELKKTDKIRKELIANVSHDLRTPLTMIKAYSEMIRDLSGDNKQKREEHLKVIIDETDRLTRLVNDMMDLSKIESGNLEINREVINYTEMVKTIVDNFRVVKENENCNFKLDLPKDIFVVADRIKIERVLYNLISNAINHSGEDEKNKLIHVKITCVGKKIKTEIIDNGIGINKESLVHIWDRYYKVNKNYKRSNTGSGLGLSIVKEIFIAHNVNYGVKSEVGKGSNFWFELVKVNRIKNAVDKEAKQIEL